MENNLDGAKALVTRINSPIGCAIAQELANRGAFVVGAYQPLQLHTGVGLNGVWEQIQESALKGIIPLDQTDPSSIFQAVNTARDSLGGLDVLVTIDVAHTSLESLLKMSDAELPAKVRANLIGPMILMRWVAYQMINSTGEASTRPHRAIGMIENGGSASGPYSISTMKIEPDTINFPIACQAFARTEDVPQVMCDLLNR